MGQFDRVDSRREPPVIPSKPLLRSEGSGRADSCWAGSPDDAAFASSGATRCTKGANPYFKLTHLPEAKR